METSWEDSHAWYDKTVGEKGHYYHQSVIFPNLLRLLSLEKGDSLLDLCCGQGVLARTLPPGVTYTGVDSAPSLIRLAKTKSSHPFIVADATKPLPLRTLFSHAAIILALQNVKEPLKVLQNAFNHLKPSGKCVLVLNHPCFRIPRQSSWQVDEAKKLQYRRIDRYLSPLEIPIQTHPSSKNSAETWSFHHPLSTYIQWLKEAGFLLAGLEEWVSDKKSSGPQARMENRSRSEFPLFLALVAIKVEGFCGI